MDPRGIRLHAGLSHSQRQVKQTFTCQSPGFPAEQQREVGAPSPHALEAPILPHTHVERMRFPTAALAPDAGSGEKRARLSGAEISEHRQCAGHTPHGAAGHTWSRQRPELGLQGRPPRPLQRCSELRPGWVSQRGWASLSPSPATAEAARSRAAAGAAGSGG